MMPRELAPPVSVNQICAFQMNYSFTYIRAVRTKIVEKLYIFTAFWLTVTMKNFSRLRQIFAVSK